MRTRRLFGCLSLRRPKRDWWQGTWEAVDELDSTFIVKIRDTIRGLKVRVFRKSYEEEFVVKKIRLDDQSLKFEVSCRTNEWRFIVNLIRISKIGVMAEITNWETLKRVACKRPTKEQLTRNSKSNPKAELLVGCWRAVDSLGEEGSTTQIWRTAQGLDVRVFDSEENFVVSNIRWQRGCLAYDVVVESNKWRTRSRLRFASKNRLIEEWTMFKPWMKTREDPLGI